ncbi:hypothetical protein IW262DRAFT_1468566 [Armillaria fumosa]|nr:hypothetical protein IW262DRAFT_1468566 [Armillaria fumosa]
MVIERPHIPLQRTPGCLQELEHLEELEKRLAQKFGIVSPQDINQIDSVGVLLEAKRHAKLPRRRLHRAILAFFQNLTGSAARSNAVDEWQKLYHMRHQLTLEGYEFGHIPHALPLPLTRGAPHHVDASRFWAVLIRIDAYESSPLQGCVSDVSLMKKFLIDDLGMPKEQIQCLLRSHDSIPDDPSTPSHANIVNMLYSLIHNDKIQVGDNIVVYYSGHGSSYLCSDCASRDVPASLPDPIPKDCDAPQNCASEHDDMSEPKCQSSPCTIEALCPIDHDTSDSQGCWIPNISDRELNALLTEISHVKGHKITFIADCCHASGMTRGLNQPETRICAMAPAQNTNIKNMFCTADERLGHLPYY